MRKSASLARKSIPDSNSKIEEIGTARVVQVDGVHAAQEVHREEQGLRQVTKAKTQAWAGLHVIGPVLVQLVRGGVGVPIELRLQAATAFRRRYGSTGAVLRIVKHIVLKTADEHRVVVGFGEKSPGAVHKVTKALGIRDASAIIRNHGTHVGAAGKIFHRFARFKPPSNSAPGKSGRAHSEDERAF